MFISIVHDRSIPLFSKSFFKTCVLLAFLTGFAAGASAENAAFDLVGPRIDVRVERKGETRNIAEVPDLQAGDRLWIHPDLPDSQSVHYLMVVAFLRGATNPPPETWFTRAETWTKPVREEGIYVIVPEEAEEAVIFLAPDTGGAFSTLRNAVRGKPGAFVRAAQDLEQASFDRSRLEAYLRAVRSTSELDPDQLKTRTTLLARSLNIRLDQQCFDKPTAEQVPCLTQNTEQLVLDDAHTQNIVATLTSGAPTDLLAQISSTPSARSGYYSPYIDAVVDVARILSTAHTAQYQYIPALALPTKGTLNLRLNNPPSFRNPKSVLVIALPQVRVAAPPPLRALDANRVFCANRPDLVLSADGAPLVFSAELAHDFVLHVEPRSGHAADLPARPDPASGGFVIDTHAAAAQGWKGEMTGVIRGRWGFRAFEGPRFRLRASQPDQWILASKDASALIVGREDTLHLQSQETCCVSEVLVRDENGKTSSAEWNDGHQSKPDELQIKVPLQNAAAGPVKVMIRQFGLSDPDELVLRTYAEAGRLDSFSINAGDTEGVLKGTRLDQVAKLEAGDIAFSPSGLTRADQHDELKVVTQDAAVSQWRAGADFPVRVTLKDGRAFILNSAVAPARPRVTLLSKTVQVDDDGGPLSWIKLGNPEELPQDGRLSFFLKSQTPEIFPPTGKVEVATADESFHVQLSVKDGNLTLQDSKTVFAMLDPMKLLGPSAFGPLKFRAVAADGTEGDWQPLVNLVRMPELKGLRCTAKPAAKASAAGPQDHPQDRDCILSGDKLFLIDAVSADPDFANAVTVPDGFTEASLAVPQPKSKTLYIKLRDDPATVGAATVPLLP